MILADKLTWARAALEASSKFKHDMIQKFYSDEVLAKALTEMEYPLQAQRI